MIATVKNSNMYRFNSLSEEIPGTLQLGALVALDEMGQVGLPQVAHVRPLENGKASLVHLEGLLPELVLLHKQAAISVRDKREAGSELVCIKY